MNSYMLLSSLVLLCLTLQGAEGTIPIAATIGAASLALTATQTTTILGGLLLLKKAALLAAAYHTNRGGVGGDAHAHKRSAEEDFTFIAASEPQQCYRRLICDLSSGQLSSKSNNNDVLLGLFSEEESSSIASPKFDYMIASKLGKLSKSIESCEIRYGCSLSGEEMNRLLA